MQDCRQDVRQTRPVTIAPAPLGSPAAGALIAALRTFEYL
jgi:hypothetical protein